MRRRLAIGAVLAVPTLALAGCLIGEPRNIDGVSIVNATLETVVVMYPDPAGESELNVYRPGGSSVENG